MSRTIVAMGVWPSSSANPWENSQSLNQTVNTPVKRIVHTPVDNVHGAATESRSGGWRPASRS